MAGKIIRDIAIGVNEIILRAAFNNSKIVVLDITHLNMGPLQPGVVLTAWDDTGKPDMKLIVTATKILLKSKIAWTATFDITVTKQY